MPEKQHESINYIELPAQDMAATEAFYQAVFGWRFEAYGPDYLAFFDKTMDGGFYRSDQCSSTDNGSALVVFYSDDLEATQSKVVYAGGIIVKPLFDFPGGRRFHFSDPNGNELAVWGTAVRT
ncbi:Uncharacterised protein [BD1-7 clade bacterium]|uniref:VOC domain-containing protein n=1 Tax=BD1-7 clade bacterium TaxID=2029982 RepID=A0A5S9PR09_9GAMM|nr:Uncharacterised protein [BD1-7 clade bacterium]